MALINVNVDNETPVPLSAKRSCGTCNQCCKTMSVPGTKEDHKWCPHARPGNGCAIYHDRPQPCRDFLCNWLIDPKIPDYWFPAKSKIVINTRVLEDGKMIINFVVDPAYPNRWREEPWFSDIKKVAKAGLPKNASRETWITIIAIKDEIIPILP